MSQAMRICMNILFESCVVKYLAMKSSKLLGGILVSVRLSNRPSDESPWPCNTPNWCTPLSWMILSKQKNLHLFSSQYICVFSKTSICPSVCPASRFRSVAPPALVGSISYLHILSSNLGRFLNLNFWQFFKICNFDFVSCFDLGSDVNH